MSRKHQLAAGQKRDSTPSGLLRARKLEVDKFNANERFYEGIPRLGSAALRQATETRQNWRLRGTARPAMTPKQEAARLRVSSRVILRAQPRRNRAAFCDAHAQRLERLTHARAPQP